MEPSSSDRATKALAPDGSSFIKVARLEVFKVAVVSLAGALLLGCATSSSLDQDGQIEPTEDEIKSEALARVSASSALGCHQAALQKKKEKEVKTGFWSPKWKVFEFEVTGCGKSAKLVIECRNPDETPNCYVVNQ